MVPLSVLNYHDRWLESVRQAAVLKAVSPFFCRLFDFLVTQPATHRLHLPILPISLRTGSGQNGSERVEGGGPIEGVGRRRGRRRGRTDN